VASDHENELTTKETRMKMQIRSKIATTLAMLAVLATVAATGCTNDDGTPAERLLRATKEGNAKLTKLRDDHAVFTTQAVVDVLAPIHAASGDFNAEVLSWQKEPPAETYLTKELDLFRQSSSELDYLLATLDSVGFAVGPEVCDTGSGSAGSGSGTPPVRTAPPSSLDDTFGADSAQYGWRYACYAGCTAAAGACAAACTALIVPPLTVASPAIVACYAACATASGACVNECSMLKCW
jgi:hypothetical protein